MRTLGKIGVRLMKIPGWQQIMLTAGTAVLGYAARKLSNRLSSRSSYKNKLERIDRLRADNIISKEEYKILRANIAEKYGR